MCGIQSQTDRIAILSPPPPTPRHLSCLSSMYITCKLPDTSLIRCFHLQNTMIGKYRCFMKYCTQSEDMCCVSVFNDILPDKKIKSSQSFPPPLLFSLLFAMRYLKVFKKQSMEMCTQSLMQLKLAFMKPWLLLCFQKCSITIEGYQVLIKASSFYIVPVKCICGLL